MTRRDLLTLLGGSLAVPLLPSYIAAAQEAWPSCTVRYVNGFPAGGATDDAVKDFTFICGMWKLPNLLAAKKDLFSSDPKELLAAFKKEPGKYTYASAGVGTTLHLSGEMMNSMAGTEVLHVPYKGGAPAMADLLGGRVDILFENLPGSLPNVRGADQTCRSHLEDPHPRASGRAGDGRGAAGLRTHLLDGDDRTAEYAC